MSSVTSPVRACPGCSDWYVSVIMQLQFQQFVEQWRVLYSSSTDWWVLPLCNRDRYAQFHTVQYGLDMSRS